MRFCQQADLERALGSASVLVQLTDKNADSVADPDQVADILDAATAEMCSYIQPTVAIESLSEPFPLALVFKTADVAAFIAWSRGSDRQAAPPNVQAAYEAAVRWGQDVGRRRATLGVVPKPSLDPPAEMIDFDSDASGISIAAFKRGFR